MYKKITSLYRRKPMYDWCNKNHRKCGCLGFGWFIEQDDSLLTCPYHYTGQKAPNVNEIDVREMIEPDPTWPQECQFTIDFQTQKGIIVQ